MQVEKLAGNQVMAGLGRWESRLDLGLFGPGCTCL